MGGEDTTPSYHLPLFETKVAKGRLAYKLYFFSVTIGLCLMSMYRVIHFPVQGTRERLVWIGMFMSELWFSLYWFITQSARWNPVWRNTFKDRLSHRYEEVLPKVDIFVCTADHTSEPPLMVVNTVLSVMAYNYPPEKLSVYLSDDGGSELMFYALLEACRFSKYWLPFCKKLNVEPRSPAAYFSTSGEPPKDPAMAEYWRSIKKQYEDMKERIDETTTLGRVPEDRRKEHRGFTEWGTAISRRDHHTILQILIDGRDPTSLDIEQQPMPSLVYLAREKRPQYHHNFKAGALNALLRVSSRISNGLVILTVDCDMYSNNSESIRDALCFFLDEKQGDEIGYIQFPQNFINLTKNDIYSTSLKVPMEVDFPGIDGNGGPPYVGTGCFHRRESISGGNYRKYEKVDERTDNGKVEEKAKVLEQTCRILASCSYEENTQWGDEVGIKYGFPVEDVVTGLLIQCRGWKSVYFNPERKAFLGLAPTTLLQTLAQTKRWVEGDFQIFVSKYCPFIYGRGKIPLKHQISYCIYLLWCPNCLAFLYYLSIPSLCMHKGIHLFPKLSSPWVLPFGYAVLATYGYSFGEYLWSGGTFQQWWNDQRMWIFKVVTAYFFGFVETILKLSGMSKEGFQLTPKVADEDVLIRYEKELMEFGSPSPMFNILATLSLINLYSFIGALKMIITDFQKRDSDLLALQTLLCGFLVLFYLPVYVAIFLRKDSGRMPMSISLKSAIIALLAHKAAATLY